MTQKPGEAVWHLSDGGSAYVVADAERAGTGLLTLAVDSLEDVPAAREGSKAVLRDPDGNRITLFEDPG